MRPRRPPSEHEEAVSRRLAALSAELSAARLEAGPNPAESEAEPQIAPASGGEWWADHTRLSRGRAPLVVVPAAAAPGDHPDGFSGVPGRHSARLPGDGASILPRTLQGRFGIGPTHLTSVAVLVAVAMALTCWWVVRGDARDVQSDRLASQPAPPLVELPEAGVAPGSTPDPPPPDQVVTTAPSGSVTVDVAGKVRRPGIAVLDPGSRVIDAVEAAGGAKPGVNLTSLNLARLLVDGEQILVGAPAGAAPAPPPTAGGESAGPTSLVNLNLASQTELETLPQVGPVTAGSIIAWREQNGGFTSIEELLEVDGIGPATLAQITPFATV